MASVSRNAYSVAVVVRYIERKDGTKRRKVIEYLSNRDIEQGADIRADRAGNVVEWL